MKNKKIITIAVILLPIVIVGIFLTTKKTQNTQQNNNFTSITELNTNSSNIFYLNNSINEISWNNQVQDSETIPRSFSITNIDLSKTADTIATKFNFDPSVFLDIGFGDKMWKNNDQIVLFLDKDKVIEVSYPTKSTFRSGFIEKQLIDESTKIVNNIIQIPNLKLHRIEYFLLDNYESEAGKMENSRIAKVHFIQTIPNSDKIIIPENFTDYSTITLTIDSSLNPRYIKINNIVENFSPSEEKIKISFQRDNIKKELLHRITPYDIDKEIELEQSQSNTLNAKNIKLEYTQKGDKLFPVYLIEGNIFIKDEDIGESTFVSPVTNSESL